MSSAGWPDLPPLLAEIAEVVGIDAALAIAEAKGGQRVTIPGRLSNGHWLVKAIGRDKAEQISAHFVAGSGGRLGLDIPLGPTGSYLAERRRRHRLVTQALADGATTNQAAQRAGITRRSVFRQKTHRHHKGQGSLF